LYDDIRKLLKERMQKVFEKKMIKKRVEGIILKRMTTPPFQVKFIKKKDKEKEKRRYYIGKLNIILFFK
jgi:hypothetical protein